MDRNSGLWASWLMLLFLLVLLTTLLGTLTLTTVEQGEKWITVGVLRIGSGSTMIVDPSHIVSPSSHVTIPEVPVGGHDVELLEGDPRFLGSHFRLARVMFQPGEFKQRRQLATVTNDSGLMALVDASHLSDEWMVSGSPRDAFIVGPDKEKVADMLASHGFRIGTRDSWRISLADPISIQDELRVADLIRTSGMLGTLSISSGSSYDRIMGQLTADRGWGVLTFADGSPGLAVAFRASKHYGNFPVFGLYDQDTLAGVEIEIGDRSAWSIPPH